MLFTVNLKSVNLLKCIYFIFILTFRRFEESLCVLAIQAYAELDQWQHVEPFLTHCYGTPAAYPVKVVQLW